MWAAARREPLGTSIFVGLEKTADLRALAPQGRPRSLARAKRVELRGRRRAGGEYPRGDQVVLQLQPLMVFPGRVDDPRTRQRLRGRHSLPHQTAGGADAALMLREARPDHALTDVDDPAVAAADAVHAGRRRRYGDHRRQGHPRRPVVAAPSLAARIPAVRELTRATVNAVKIVIDDRTPNVLPLSDSIVAALVDEAHRSGLRAIAHMVVVTDISTARRLMELGLDEFVHPPSIIAADPVPDEVSPLAKILTDRKVPVTTTVSVFDAYKDASGAEQASNGGPYTPVRRQSFERLLRIVPVLANAGVRLVVGTDWVDRPINADDPRLMPGAKNLHEMEILRRAGLTTTDILTATTRDATEALGVADKLHNRGGQTCRSCHSER